MMTRVGVGYDSHRFAAGRPLVLGGVRIPFGKGLAGHSDADAVCHAISDALLGAAALGDIGSHFPPADPSWKDADSTELLSRIAELVREAGWSPGGVDVTVVCEEPRIGPFREAMRARIAEVLRLPADRVSVKGKSNEGMGWIGRGEGVAVIAVATLVDRPSVT